VVIAGLLALMGLGLASAPIGAGTTERVVADRHTGLAIGGYDSVAYFTEKAAQLGRPDLELAAAGVVWRFRNEGNRAAFAANPDVFMPRFGGYDPIALARGASAAGHPELWVVAEERLYLFYSEAARATFTENPDRAIDAAERRWPEVLRTLAR
jgi:hypothetical protein